MSVTRKRIVENRSRFGDGGNEVVGDVHHRSRWRGGRWYGRRRWFRVSGASWTPAWPRGVVLTAESPGTFLVAVASQFRDQGASRSMITEAGVDCRFQGTMRWQVHQGLRTTAVVLTLGKLHVELLELRMSAGNEFSA